MNTTLRMLAPIAAATLVLGGCGAAENLVEGAMEEAVEKGVEGATGADVEGSEDGFSVKTDEGEFTVGGDGSLPEGFPEGDVPLVDGEIIQTAKVSDGGSDGYAVTMQVGGTIEDVHADALAKLEGAGFTSAGEVDMDEMKSSTLEGAGSVGGVVLGVMGGSEDGMVSVSYTVTMATE
ncbi:hypothetical protein ACNI3K_04795 [Demequina sp. SO4-13]|uniref:hypothetical protein n=1 Tax=Demequina sp. SO4-13 TaxID=3401027 RepID=UPI003AF57B2F